MQELDVAVLRNVNRLERRHYDALRTELLPMPRQSANRKGPFVCIFPSLIVNRGKANDIVLHRQTGQAFVEQFRFRQKRLALKGFLPIRPTVRANDANAAS